MDLQKFLAAPIDKMSSREIAQLTGKRHDNVLRDCDTVNFSYENLGLLKIEEGYYTHQNTGKQKHREMLLNKMQTMDLMTGYNVELRIKVNRRWEELENAPKIDIAAITRKDLAEMLLDSEVEIEKLQTENAKLTLKTQFVDQVFEIKDNITFSQASKTLGLPYGRNTLCKKLREQGILFKNTNEPKQTFVDRGYFVLKEIFIKASEKVVFQTMITQKGLAFLASQLGVIIHPLQKTKTA